MYARFYASLYEPRVLRRVVGVPIAISSCNENNERWPEQIPTEEEQPSYSRAVCRNVVIGWINRLF